MIIPYKVVLVKFEPLRTLMEWCSDAIDLNSESDKQAARAFRALKRDIQEQVANFGCQHGAESGSICRECGKIV